MSDTKFIVFIDALSPNDLSRCDFMPSTMDGELESSVPRVTPDVMSMVYTGKDQAENGMGRVHSHDDISCGSPTRPEQDTIMEEAIGEGKSVLGLNMPYGGPANTSDNNSAIHTTNTGESHFVPQDSAVMLNIPGPTGDLSGEPNHELAFDMVVDYTTQMFAAARSLSQRHDVVFVGYRNIDSYCHFQYDMGEDGRHADVGKRYRDFLAEVVDIQLKQMDNLGDVFWFSDHGATQKTDTFRVNKFLKEQGYLDYTYDKEFEEKAIDKGLIQQDQTGPTQMVENQLVLEHPQIDVGGVDAVCSDPYDSCITVFNEDITDDLIADLEATGKYRSVYHKSDLYNEESEFYDQIPHIIPDRKEGLFVSGNVHPEPIGMGWYRTGVHDKWGCYGSTTGEGGGTVNSIEMNHLLKEFIGIE